MDARLLKQRYLDNLRLRSGLDSHRPYLGMSQISNCPRQLYDRFLNGSGRLSDRAHWFCRIGYLWQREVLDMLDMPATYQETEIVAGFDARYRGHVDWELDQSLIEVKSVSWEIFLRVAETKYPIRSHNEQVQSYLRHGNGYKSCIMVYVARDVPLGQWDGIPVWMLAVYPKQETQDTLDDKARRVLKAVDEGIAPQCACGRCGQGWTSSHGF